MAPKIASIHRLTDYVTNVLEEFFLLLEFGDDVLSLEFFFVSLVQRLRWRGGLAHKLKR